MTKRSYPCRRKKQNGETCTHTTTNPTQDCGRHGDTRVDPLDDDRTAELDDMDSAQLEAEGRRIQEAMGDRAALIKSIERETWLLRRRKLAVQGAEARKQIPELKEAEASALAELSEIDDERRALAARITGPAPDVLEEVSERLDALMEREAVASRNYADAAHQLHLAEDDSFVHDDNFTGLGDNLRAAKEYIEAIESTIAALNEGRRDQANADERVETFLGAARRRLTMTSERMNNTPEPCPMCAAEMTGFNDEYYYCHNCG